MIDCNRRAWLLAALLLMLAAGWCYGGMVSAQRLVLGNDLVGDFFHWRLFLARSLAAGHIPEWNPYVFCGQPFIAAGQSAVWYPLNLLLYRLVPVTLGLNLELFIHVCWYALGTLFFLRAIGARPPGALLGALLALLSPAAVTELAEGHPAQLAALCWLPWSLAAVERLWQRPAISFMLILAAATGGALLAGHPQFTFYVGFVTLGYFLLRGLLRRERAGLVRTTGLALAGALLGLALGAAQLLPLMEVREHLTRSGADLAFLTRFDPPAGSWLRLLAPAPPDPAVPLSGALAWWGGAWMLALLGVGLYGREPAVVACIVLTLLTLLLAMGSSSALYPLAVAHVPGFALFRVPARLLFATYLMLAALAARGLDFAVLPGERALRRVALAGAALFLLAAAGVLLGLPATVMVAAAVAAGMLVLFWLAALRPQRRRLGHLVLAMALVLVQAVPYMRSQLRMIPAAWLEQPSPLVAALQAHDSGSRYLALDDLPIESITSVPLFNRGIDYRLRHCGGSDAVVLRSFQGLYNLTQGREPGERALVFRATRGDHPLLDRLAVRQVLSSETVPGTVCRVRPGTLDRVAGVYERPRAAGLFALARAVRWVDPEMMEGHIPAALTDDVTLAEPCSAELGRPFAGDTLTAIVTGEGRAAVRVVVGQPRLLTYAESWYPGWEVFIDQMPARLLKVDGGLMGTVVPEGRHQVVFRFRSATVRTGLIYSLRALMFWLLLAAAAAAAAAWQRWRRSHRAW
ncbi:MAG TPA: hypothetical protein PKM88_01245 [bacterium]|nr:hypothetical protein [bacterium]